MIAVEHLTKYYGDVLAVDDLSFEIEEGHVYGFLGPNGAGKSTTMNIMTGCLSATAGRVLIDGHDIFEEPGPAKRLIGYLPEQPPLYVSETPVEYLTFVGEAKGLRGAELRRQIEAVVGQTGLEPVRRRRIAALSKGYRQRVGIAQALLGQPKVVILDEPTIGLDPLQIVEIRDLIKELGRHSTVIFSSHILSEVQAICDRILIIAHGRLVAFDEPGRLEQDHKAPSELRLLAEAGADEVREILAGVDGLAAVAVDPRGDGLSAVRVRTDRDGLHDVTRALFFAFAGRGKALLEMTAKVADLEDVFIGLTESAATPDEGDDEDELDGEDELDELDELGEPDEPDELGDSDDLEDLEDLEELDDLDDLDDLEDSDGLDDLATLDAADGSEDAAPPAAPNVPDDVTEGTVPFVTPEGTVTEGVTEGTVPFVTPDPDPDPTVTKGTVPGVTPDSEEARP